MKKAKIISAFIDKITRQYHNIGEVIEVSEERFKELLSKNKIVAHEEAIEAEAKKVTKKKKYWCTITKRDTMYLQKPAQNR